MKYKITLPQGNDLTGVYLSIPFVNGVGETDNEFIADKAKLKCFEVETQEESQEETQELFQCPHCNQKPYKQEDYLKAHILKKHPEFAEV